MSKRAKHTKTLCKGCVHGIEHHPDRGACVYGHATPTGGCRCPAFNTPKSKIPDSPPFTFTEATAEEARKRVPVGTVKSVNPDGTVTVDVGLGDVGAHLIHTAELLLGALRGFIDAFKDFRSRGGVASTLPPSVDAVRSRGRAPTSTPQVGAEAAMVPRRARAPEEAGSIPVGSENGVTSTTTQTSGAEMLGPGALKVLAAIATSHREIGCTDRTIAVITGYKPTSRKTYLADLRAHGLIESRPLGGVTRHYTKNLSDLLKDVVLVRGLVITGLPPGELKMFAAIASSNEGRDDRELAVLTGYAATSRKTYLAKLVGRELVEVIEDEPLAGRRILTPEARAELVFLREPLPEILTGAELLEHHKTLMPEGEAFVLDAIAFNPPCTMHEIGTATGYKPTSVKTYVAKLRARSLVVRCGEGVGRGHDGSYDLAPELVS